jgi:peptidoglycan/xylan/chitin deacetylase (PgdA/CDA1 family)
VWGRRPGVAFAVLVGAALLIASMVWRPFSLAEPLGRAPTPAAEVPPAAQRTAEPVSALRTVVSLTFDGGTPSQYRLARPLLRQFRMNGTFYLATARVDRAEACCISWEQARDLYRSGDEIGATGLDGVDLTVRFSRKPAADHAAKKRQICGAGERLRALGFDPRSFAYPAGAFRSVDAGSDRSLPRLVRSCGFLSGRIVGGLSEHGDQPSNPLPPTDPYVLRTPDEVTVSPLTLADLQRPVTTAARSSRTWVPLVLNEICHPGDADYATCRASRRSIDDSVLAQFLTWLSRAGQPGGAPIGTGVATVRQTMDAPPQPPLPVSRTFVSLTFDDGDVTQPLAGDILRAHGMHATFFVNTGLIDQRNPYYMSWPQVLKLYREGNEIGGHTATHVRLTDSRLSLKVRRDEVCRDRGRLLQKGIDARSFAYPEGAVDRVAKTLVRSCGYRSARTAGGVNPAGPLFAEAVPPMDRFATAALDGPEAADQRGAVTQPAQPLTLEELKGAIVSAAAQSTAQNTDGVDDRWVQIVLHRICATTDPMFLQCMSSQSPIDDHAFRAFLDWLRHGAPSGTVVRTVSEVMSSSRK